MVVNGVSTRKVSRITEELCGTKFSKSTVSELCKNLDPIMKAQLNRSLSDDEIPFLLVDALYLKIREDGRVRSRGVMIAVGMMVGDTESETGWSGFFSSLKDIRLHGANIITSDDDSGLVLKCILIYGAF